MKDIYRELMRRSIQNAHDVIEDSSVESIQNVDQFALEIYRFRVMAPRTETGVVYGPAAERLGSPVDDY